MKDVAFASIKGSYLDEDKIEEIGQYPTIVMYKNKKKVDTLEDIGEAQLK